MSPITQFWKFVPVAKNLASILCFEESPNHNEKEGNFWLNPFLLNMGLIVTMETDIIGFT